MKFLRKDVILLTLLLVFFVEPVISDMPVKDYLKYKNTDLTNFYLTGLESGLRYANIELISLKLPMLYCVPPKLGININTIKQIIDNNIKLMPLNLSEDTPIELIFIDSLKQTFPCPHR